MVNLIDLFHQKVELIRLEKKYINGRRRRSHFVSEAIYVDGEYLYEQPPQSPRYASSSKPTSSSSKNSRSSSSLGSSTTISATESSDKHERKRMSWGGSWGRGKNAEAEKRRELMVSVKEVNWEDSRA